MLSDNRFGEGARTCRAEVCDFEGVTRVAVAEERIESGDDAGERDYERPGGRRSLTIGLRFTASSPNNS